MVKPWALSGLFICISFGATGVYADTNNLMFHSESTLPAGGYQQIDDSSSETYGRDQSFFPGDQGYHPVDVNHPAYASGPSQSQKITNDYREVSRVEDPRSGFVTADAQPPKQAPGENRASNSNATASPVTPQLTPHPSLVNQGEALSNSKRPLAQVSPSAPAVNIPASIDQVSSSMPQLSLERSDQLPVDANGPFVTPASTHTVSPQTSTQKPPANVAVSHDINQLKPVTVTAAALIDGPSRGAKPAAVTVSKVGDHDSPLAQGTKSTGDNKMQVNSTAAVTSAPIGAVDTKVSSKTSLAVASPSHSISHSTSSSPSEHELPAASPFIGLPPAVEVVYQPTPITLRHVGHNQASGDASQSPMKASSVQDGQDDSRIESHHAHADVPISAKKPMRRVSKASKTEVLAPVFSAEQTTTSHDSASNHSNGYQTKKTSQSVSRVGDVSTPRVRTKTLVSRPSSIQFVSSNKEKTSIGSVINHFSNNLGQLKYHAFFNYLGVLSLKLKSTNYPIPGIGKLPTGVDGKVFSNTNVGFSLLTPLAPHWRLGSKIVLRGTDLGSDSAFKGYLSSLYAGYHKANTSINLGKLEFPGLFYSKSEALSDNYPFVLLPSEVYSSIDPFSSITGGEFSYQNQLNQGEFSLKTDAYAGLAKANLDLGGDMPTTLNTKNDTVVGGALTMSHQKALSMKLSYTFSSLYGHRLYNGVSSKVSGLHSGVFTAGLKAQFKILNLTSEYIRRKLSDKYSTQQGYYAAVSSQLGWFEPSFTLGHFDTLKDPAVGYGAKQQQTSYAVGMRFHLTKYIDSKISFTHVTPQGGTGGLGIGSNEKDNLVAFSVSGEFTNDTDDDQGSSNQPYAY